MNEENRYLHLMGLRLLRLKGRNRTYGPTRRNPRTHQTSTWRGPGTASIFSHFPLGRNAWSLENMEPNHRLAMSTLLVREYDEAIGFFVGTLGFVLIEDTELHPGKRWVVVSPSSSDSSGLLLARASDAAQQQCIGKQTGGRVGFFLTTDDFETSYRRLQERGVRFCETPRKETYGLVAVFLDLYGNRWDLIQPAQGAIGT